MSSRQNGIMLALLAAAALFGWFVMADMPRGAILFGFLLGTGAASAMIPQLATLPARLATMVALGSGLFGLLLYSMMAREISLADMGDTTAHVVGSVNAIAGLFGGLALRALLQAVFGRKDEK